MCCFSQEREATSWSGGAGGAGGAGAGAAAVPMLERVAAVSDRVSMLFPAFVAVASTAALYRPVLFSWFGGGMLIGGLMFTMMSMGTTLSPRQLLAAVRSGKEIAIGFLLQFTIMPALGFAVSRVVGLGPQYTAGLILVSCCPGGVASNVVCYLAQADVALSVALTSFSTVCAVAMTPLLTSALLGTSVSVDAAGLFASTVKVVLVPVIVGSSLSQYAPRVMSCFAAVAPAVSVVAIVFINASVVAQSAESILATGGKLIAATFMLHTGGFLLGYLVPVRARRRRKARCRGGGGGARGACPAVLTPAHPRHTHPRGATAARSGTPSGSTSAPAER